MSSLPSATRADVQSAALCLCLAGVGLPDDNFNLFEDDPIEELDIDLGDMDEFAD